MPGMNFNDHYGTVYDMPGVRYQQHGVYYRHDGSPVDSEPQEPTREPDAPSQKITNNGWSPDDLRRPENKALKAQLDIYGVEWSTAAAAREFLSRGRE